LAVLSRNTSFEVREQAGLSLKSSLKHIISIDLRDDVIFPTLGSLLQLTSEAAGLGGDVGFLKNEFFVQGNYSIAEDFVSCWVIRETRELTVFRFCKVLSLEVTCAG
jgi:outer membrane protein insertion porin family